MNIAPPPLLSQQLDRDGVVLIKGILPDAALEEVRPQYDELDKKLTRTDIATDRPLVVFWRHVIGEQKRIGHFDEFPALWSLIVNHIVPSLRKSFPAKTKRLQLLETIIFNKPAEISNTLNWHQDVAYFPMKPNNQLAVWIPFEIVTAETGGPWCTH